MSYLQVDIAAYKAHVADLLAAHPELSEDEDLRADVFEGETDLHPLASRLVRIIKEREARAAGTGEYISELQGRKARELKGAEGAKALLKSLLLAADIPKLTLPEATVSVTKPRTKCVVDDVNDLPQGFYEIERKAKTADIKAELEAGRSVPGARLEQGQEGLMVKTK